MSNSFVRRSRLPAPAPAVFAWHAREGAFERLSPPWQRVDVLERQGGIEDGARVVLRMGRRPFSVRWVAQHCDYVEGRSFRDEQVRGPFALWSHTHLVEPDGPEGCYLEDRIEYAAPLGAFGKLLARGSIEGQLDRLFRYRHRITRNDIAAHARYEKTGGKPMKVAVTGASGLIGTALVPFLTTGGHQIARLVRGKARRQSGEIAWDPDGGRIDKSTLAGFDAVVHLAGESIVGGRWTAAKKARIRDSRVEGTRVLAEALAAAEPRPKVLVCASAVGYYGDRGGQILEEDSAPGAGFLAEVCQEWEAAAAAAVAAGLRVAHLRFGVVLSPAGGALQTMLTPFRLGLGGVVGSGSQYMSWIALDDAVGAIHHTLSNPQLHGPINAVAPNPVTNREYTRVLGRVLSRPTVLPIPAFAAHLALGEMADELLLSSTRAVPAKLLASGYEFLFPELEPALRHLLGK